MPPPKITNRFMSTSIACILIALCTSVAYAANTTFYINAEEGDDNADGRSEASAWRTLKHANERIFAPGDELLLKAGCRWAEPLTLQGSGTQEDVIRVGRYGSGARPLIAGDQKSHSSLILKNGSYWVIEDLEITNTRTNGKLYKKMHGVQVVADSGGVFRQIVLRGLHVHHVSGVWDRPGGSGIEFRATSGGDFGDYGLPHRPSRFDGLLIENCYVHDVSFYGILVSGWENRFRDERWFPNTGVVLRNNFTHDTGGDSIVVITCENALLEHNEAHRCAVGQLNGGKTHAAGIWPHSSDGTVMRYNKVQDILAEYDGQAFDVDIDCNNTLLEHNLSQRNPNGFLLLCATSKAQQGTSGIIVRNNVSIDDGYTPKNGIFKFVGDVRDVTIENNVFLSSVKREQKFMRTWQPKKNKGWETDILFRNNIFSMRGTVNYHPVSFIVPTFEGNMYAGQFQNLPRDATGISVEYPAVRIDNGRVVPLHTGTDFKPFDISKAGLLPTSSWLEQRDLSASGEMMKRDSEQDRLIETKGTAEK